MRLAFVGDEYGVALLSQANELEADGRFAGWPTTCEIGVAVQAVVQRAREMEVVGDDRFDLGPVVVDIRQLTTPGDGD